MDKPNHPSWLTALARCLQQGNADANLIIYLDDILSWWFSPDSQANIESLNQSALKSDASNLQRSFEEFVDQLIVANPINYQKVFPPELSESRAKARYRHLIRVFHPDRGQKPEAWLTYRAERVNAAYSEFSQQPPSKRSSNGTLNKVEGHQADKTQQVPRKSKRKVIPPINAQDMRRWLGNPDKLQKNVLVGLIALAAFIVALLLLSALVV